MSDRSAPSRPGARSVFTRRQRWLLFAAFALLIVCRLPLAWVEGRFLDEEATVFLAYAWHRPWADALFRAFAGYWNLGANATTLLVATLVKGGVVPLERAPYLTMTVALAVQLSPGVLILTGGARWLAGRAAVVAALLTIAIAPATEEVFLNVLHIQFHLALCAALILALDAPRRRFAAVGYALLLVLAPLCGPGAIVILPLFALRALVDRERARLVQLAAFAIGAAVQLAFFYGASPIRGHLLDPATIAATMFVRLIALPALNFGSANLIGGAIHGSWAGGGTGWLVAAGIALLLFGLLIVQAMRRRDAAIWLALAGLGIAVASFGFGMVIVDQRNLFDVGAGERYNFLPLVLVNLALIALAMRPGATVPRVPAALCLLMLLTGAIRYGSPLADFATGPSWPAEVAAWRRDHRHPLAVWPTPYAADLSDTAQDCPPPALATARRDSAPSTAPRYCESGWVAAFFRSSPSR